MFRWYIDWYIGCLKQQKYCPLEPSQSIECIRVQWNHSDLSGCGSGWAVARKQGYIKLSEAEEPVDTHWTVTVVGAD